MIITTRDIINDWLDRFLSGPVFRWGCIGIIGLAAVYFGGRIIGG